MSVVDVKKSAIVHEKFEAGKADLKLVGLIDRKQDAPFAAGIIEVVASEP